MSIEFSDLVKGIGETRSKDEEWEIVRREVTKLRVACQKPEYTTLHAHRNGKAGNNISNVVHHQCVFLIRLNLL